jgi:hypothetical protein
MKEAIVRKFKIDEKRIVVLGIKDIYGLFKKKTTDDLGKLLEKINFEKYF